MRPTQWRPSTHLMVGVGVLAIVAAVVAATALFTGSGRGASGAQIPPPPPAVTAKPSIVPVAATAPVPTAGCAGRDPGAGGGQTPTWASWAVGSPTR